MLAADITPQVAYGVDNRHEILQLDGARTRLAAAMVALTRGDGRLAGQQITINAPTLAQARQLCPGQRFARQPVPAFCAGALVGPDLVLTAGHCVGPVPLDQMLFVFGFQMLDYYSNARTTIPGKDVYAVRRVVKRVQNDQADYALIRLDRQVTGRQPIAVARTNTFRAGTPLFVIGYPSGLPAKFADAANVRALGSTQFLSNLGTFEGNSGSPVFNAKNNLLVGVLDSGAEDYVKRGACNVVNQLPRNAGREASTRSTVFAGEIPAR